MPGPTPSTHISLSYSSTIPLRGEGATSGKGQSTNLKGTERALTQTQGFFSRNMESDPTLPNREVRATEQKGSPGSHMALALVPLSPAKLPTNDSCQHNLGKDLICVHARYSSPTMPLGTLRLYRDAPTQGHTFKTATGNYFT